MFVEKVNGTELKFKNPGQLLLVVISFIFWGVGFLDLLGHTSAEPEIFGLYSLPFFGLLILYGCTGALWILLFVNPNILSRVSNGVRYIQNNTFLALTVFAAFGIALWVIFEWDRWSRLPGLQFTAFGLIVFAALILLITDWSEKNGMQVWRRIIAYPLIVLFVLEGIFQGLAWFGALPVVRSIGGDFYPYERVYYQGEGTRNGFANRYGWYFPDQNLDDEKKRILVVGGSYVQALHIQPEQQFNALLTTLINQGQKDASAQAEIISIGLPGFGLSPFLSEEYVHELPELLDIDEILVVFHLGDDFQSPVPSNNAVRFTVAEANEIEVNPEDARLRHDLTHYYLRGFMSFQLVETVRNNYLTPKVITSLFRDESSDTRIAGMSTQGDAVDFPRLVGFVSDTYAVTETGHAGIKETDMNMISMGNNFMFSKDTDPDRSEALVIAETILKTTQEITQDKNITLRVVTIPLFPEAFYGTYRAGDWEPIVDGYDLFLPERALIDIAAKHDIPILPMGQYMLQDGLKTEEIKGFYLRNGGNSFTPEGHKYYADAIYSTFYQTQK